MKKINIISFIFIISVLLTACRNNLDSGSIVSSETILTYADFGNISDNSIKFEDTVSEDNVIIESDYDFDEPVVEDTVSEDTISSNSSLYDDGLLIVIDPGHQEHQDLTTEAVSPSSSQQKAKVSSGTRGVGTGLFEYQLNLNVSLKLKKRLEELGYFVIITRTTNEVNISNVERTLIANNCAADALIHIHANGSDDLSKVGMMTICPTQNNTDTTLIYQDSKLLSECVLDSMVAKTGAVKEYVWETDTMTGINWSKVPVTIIEMGYMTNPVEDAFLYNDQYQEKISEGIADGINAFFARKRAGDYSISSNEISYNGISSNFIPAVEKEP